MYPTYKLSRRKNAQPEKMCDIVCDKVKDRGRTVNRANVYAEATIPKVFSKRCYEKFHRTHKKTSVPESLFAVFLWILRNLQERLFLQDCTRRLGLIIAVSIAVKRVPANETVNYETRTKVYVLIWARSVSYWQGQVRWKSRFQKQAFADFKMGILKNLVNFAGKHICWSLVLIKLQFWGPTTLLKKIPTQVFSCEIYKIQKKNCFEEHLWTSA